MVLPLDPSSLWTSVHFFGSSIANARVGRSIAFGGQRRHMGPSSKPRCLAVSCTCDPPVRTVHRCFEGCPFEFPRSNGQPWKHPRSQPFRPRRASDEAGRHPTVRSGRRGIASLGPVPRPSDPPTSSYVRDGGFERPPFLPAPRQARDQQQRVADPKMDVLADPSHLGGEETHPRGTVRAGLNSGRV